MVKIAALIVVLLVCLAPALYNRIQPTRDSSSEKDKAEARRREQAERMREYRRRHPPYKGPKTDEKINRMMAECIVLLNTERSLRNTLIHELLHTVPGGLCHTGEWKKWARYVSAKTGYNIHRFDGDDTEQDKKNIRAGCID